MCRSPRPLNKKGSRASRAYLLIDQSLATSLAVKAVADMHLQVHRRLVLSIQRHLCPAESDPSLAVRVFPQRVDCP